MGKRTFVKIETKESKALKKLRIISGLSLRKLSNLMGVSFALVHQKEEGRSEINSSYVDKFLGVTSISKHDWEELVNSSIKSKRKINSKLKDECVIKLNNLSEAQLLALRSVLENL